MIQEANAAPAASTEIIIEMCRAAGYMVCTWGAIENGDEADSYFWRVRGAAGGSQSAGTFNTEHDAWRDCCESTGMLNPYFSMLAEEGVRIARPAGFLMWHWEMADGTKSPPFVHASEAVVDAAITLTKNLHVSHAEESGIAEAP